MCLMGRNVTINDVAKRAGVSITTVSRILNNKPDVAPATRRRVLEVIQELSYTPHAQAQNLAAGRSRSIALLYPSDSMGFSEMEFEFFVGCSQVAAKAGFLFNLIVNPVTEHDLLNLFRSSQVDGVILMEIHLRDWRVELLRERHYPFVLIGRCQNNTGLSFVDVDFEYAMMTACEYLYSLGHRQIGFINLAGSLREQDYGPAVRSFRGYEQACAQYRLPVIACDALPTIDALCQVTGELLAEHPDLTALITLHCGSLVGAMRAAQKQGLAVPDDLSVMGILTDQIAQLLTPPLTAISFPARAMGARAMQMLIRKLRDETYKDKQITLKPPLVARESTAPVYPK
jgi:DNA-binding LacI/PurR family transcriptional regulator